MMHNFHLNKGISYQSVEIFFYGTLLFSYTSLTLFTISESYYAEIPIAALLFFSVIRGGHLGRLFTSSLIRYKTPIIIGGTIIVTAFVIGYIRRGDVIASYADLRSNFLTFLMFFVGAYAIQSRSTDQIMRLALYCSFVAILYWLYYYLTGSLDSKFQVPLMACLVVIAADSIAKKAGALSYIALILVSWLAAVSFYRSNWIYPASALGLILMSGNSRTRVWNMAMLTLIFVPIAIIAVPFLDNFYNSSESFKIQSILKTQDLIMYFQGVSALSESDSLRMGYFVYLENNWLEHFFPHGLGSRAFYGDIGDWFLQYSILANTADSVLFFIVFHYGWIVALPLMLYLTSIFFRFIKSYGFLTSALLLMPVGAALLFDGGSALVIQRSLWFGLYLGIIYGLIKIRAVSRHE